MLICNSLGEEKKIHYPKDLCILPVCVFMNSFKSLHKKKESDWDRRWNLFLFLLLICWGVRSALSSASQGFCTIQLDSKRASRGRAYRRVIRCQAWSLLLPASFLKKNQHRVSWWGPEPVSLTHGKGGDVRRGHPAASHTECLPRSWGTGTQHSWTRNYGVPSPPADC